MRGNPEHSAPTIHVVDDDPSVLVSLSRLLRSVGYQVAEFGSAEELLVHRRNFPDVPGCAIVDLNLPGLSGLELQETLSQRKEGLPLVFLTGHGDIRTSVHAMKREAVDFLTKPASDVDLLAAVERAVTTDAEAREMRLQKEEILARYQQLTPREREVLALVVRGMLNKQIAFELGTAERTIKAHRAKIMAKMRVQSVAELVHLTGYLDDTSIPSGNALLHQLS